MRPPPWWLNSICERQRPVSHTGDPWFSTTSEFFETPFVSDEFCFELASALAVMLLEFNAELEEFCYQIDCDDPAQPSDQPELEVVH